MTWHDEQHSEALNEALAARDADKALALFAQLPPGEDVRVFSRLDEADRAILVALLPVDDVARLLREMSVSQAADLLGLLPAARAAEVLQRLPSNDQADLLAAMEEGSELLLAALPEATARRLERLVAYAPDSTGGAMVDEYLSYRHNAIVADVIDDLRAQAGRYAQLQAQYAYIVDAADRLTGVLRLRDLLLLERNDPIVKAMTPNPVRVRPELSLVELARHFDRHPFFALPVVDGEDRLLGVVLRNDVEEAMTDRADRQMLLLSGVFGGEEFRSMRWADRLARRLPWLAVSLALSLVASSVIGLYEETLSQVLALAIFLPVISGLGGNSGNQALSISIRELSAGLIETHEYLWVVRKEAAVAMVSGVVIGAALALISYAWQRHTMLSLVIGVAIATNTLVSACLGGMLPLLIKRLGWDPALAAGPILFTVVDLFGFLVTLALADWMITG